MSLRQYESVMKAMADPTRVRILKMPEPGELCVCQIIAPLAPAGVRISSAGSAPAFVRPKAIQVLKEIGFDISAHRSKAIDEIDTASVEADVTLCAEEVCPVLLGSPVKEVYWGLADPASTPGDDAARPDAFEKPAMSCPAA